MYRNNCTACPRQCGYTNYCGVPQTVVIARAGLHFGEEPSISGKRGSGTVFFAGCNLGCVFCQNREISHRPTLSDYRSVTAQELADMFRRLEDLGAHNINLVTPSHYTSALLGAFKLYRPSVPIVYNTSSYEKMETVERIGEYVDVWLPDIKFHSSELSSRLCGAPDYFDVASRAVETMRRISPTERIGADGLIKSGMIVRHLILPSHTDDSLKVLDFVAALSPAPQISLMSQYIPAGDAALHSDIARRLTSFEYKKVTAYADSLNLDGFTQERTSATAEYVPIWGEYPD